MNSTRNLEEARRRIAACLMRDPQGNLVQRHDHLNLAGLGLTTEDLLQQFDPQERNLKAISFADLLHLRYLNLNQNALTELPECVCDMTSLEWLGVNFNRLESLPDDIGRLRALKRLYARGNQLKTLPAKIGSLTRLLELDLHANKISELPVEMLPILEGSGADAVPGHNALYLDLRANPGQLSMAAEQGTATLASFLRGLREERGQPQGKLLFVGEGRVGKSSLLRALLGQNHDPDLLTTHGLRIETWKLSGIAGHAMPLRLNCWDFSGQEQMRETHQMFFTAPALYLLVWDPDRNQRQAEDQLYEWLWLIHQSQREGARAKVLIVATNHRSRDRHEPDNREQLLQEFGPAGADILSGFASVESDDQRGARYGIAEVEQWVKDQIALDSSFTQGVPGAWERVIGVLGESRQPQMNWTEYESECRKLSKNAPSFDVAAMTRQMSTLGRLVWYEDEPALSQHVILRPDWLGKAISYVFERAGLAAEPGTEPETPLGRGLVSRQTMDAIWASPGVDECGKPEPGYAKEMFPIFRRLMIRFGLLQPLSPRSIPGIPNIPEEDQTEFFLVPARLGRDQPANWDASWNVKNKIALCYSLTSRGLRRDDANAPLNSWLARAVFGRLMVLLHPLAQGREHVQNIAHWESGLRLRDTLYGEARLHAERDKVYFEGSVQMHGQVVSALRQVLGSLNRRFGTQMDFIETIGCQPAQAKSGELPSCLKPLPRRRYFTRDDLQNCLDPKDGEPAEPTIRCLFNGCQHRIDVYRSLYGVSIPRTGFESIREGQLELSTGFKDLLDEFRRSHGSLSDQLREQHRQLLVSWRESIGRALLEHEADISQHGPVLFSVQSADGHSFWTDMGPRAADKYVLHVHCEHTLYPASWFIHEGQRPPGVFEFEQPKPWLVNAGPVIKGIGQMLTLGSPVAAVFGLAEARLLLEPPAKILEKAPAELFSHPINLPLDDVQKAGSRPQAQEATGETLNKLHQFLRERLKTQNLQMAPGLGLVRVRNNLLNRYSWVHRFYAELYGGPA